MTQNMLKRKLCYFTKKIPQEKSDKKTSLHEKLTGLNWPICYTI